MKDNTINDTIRECAMLVSMHTSGWSARHRDEEASRAADESKGAKRGSYNAWGNLMKDNDDRLKTVRRIQGAARQSHLELTQSWTTGDVSRGPRLLPTARWQDYLKEMGTHRKELTKAVDDFITHYPADAKAAMGALGMNPADSVVLYPKASDLKSRFTITNEFQPIPSGADFKGIAPEFQAHFAEAYEKKMAEKFERALSNVLEDAVKALEQCSDRLLNSKRLFQSTYDAVAVLPERIRGFNVTDDERATNSAVFVDRWLAAWTSESIKPMEVREQAADDAQAAAESIKVEIAYTE